MLSDILFVIILQALMDNQVNGSCAYVPKVGFKSSANTYQRNMEGLEVCKDACRNSEEVCQYGFDIYMDLADAKERKKVPGKCYFSKTGELVQAEGFTHYSCDTAYQDYLNPTSTNYSCLNWYPKEGFRSVRALVQQDAKDLEQCKALCSNSMLHLCRFGFDYNTIEENLKGYPRCSFSTAATLVEHLGFVHYSCGSIFSPTAPPTTRAVVVTMMPPPYYSPAIIIGGITAFLVVMLIACLVISYMKVKPTPRFSPFPNPPSRRSNKRWDADNMPLIERRTSAKPKGSQDL